MRAALAFLFVALSCFFGSGNTGFVTSGGSKSVASNVPMVPESCLNKLIQVDVPQALERLQQLLCLYMKGKKDQNEQLYKLFLMELHEALKDAGCTVDEILSTPEFLEKVGNQVGEVAEKLGLEIFKIVEGLGVSDLVLNVLCDLLGDTLKSLSQSLGGLNLNLNGATHVLKGLPILG